MMKLDVREFMTAAEPETGTLCVSVAGHDAGRLYIITEVSDRDFVRVADGEYHSVAKPKRKNIKHLKPIMSDDCNRVFQESDILAVGNGAVAKLFAESLCFADACRRVLFAAMADREKDAFLRKLLHCCYRGDEIYKGRQ